MLAYHKDRISNFYDSNVHCRIHGDLVNQSLNLVIIIKAFPIASEKFQTQQTFLASSIISTVGMKCNTVLQVLISTVHNFRIKRLNRWKFHLAVKFDLCFSGDRGPTRWLLQK